MNLMRTLSVAGLMLLSLVVRGQAAPDPFLGRWILDTKASKYPGHTCPQRMVIEMTLEAKGVHYHSETQPSVGEPFHVDYVAHYDGRPAMVTGDRGILLPVTLSHEDPRHVKASYGNGFRVMATSTRTVSDSGDTMTITTVSHDEFGVTQTSTGVYRRAAAPRK